MSGSIGWLVGITLFALLTLYAGATLFVAHRFTTPKRIALPVPPARSGAQFERVELRARHDAHQLIAWYRPAPAATGAVILVHGRDSCRGAELRGSTFELALQLAHSGLSILMLDLRGHGESADSRLSFGRRERFDVLGAVDHLRQKGYANGRIGILGASMGAASALAAAAEEPGVGAVISDSAYADLRELLMVQFTRLTRLPQCCLSSALLAAHALTGENLVRHTPLQSMRALRGRPTLVIHACGDPFVPVQHARTLATAGEASIWITDSERHLGSFGNSPDEYATRVSSFFSTHLLSDVPHLDDVVTQAVPHVHDVPRRRIALVS
jgi:uncharacterized protein